MWSSATRLREALAVLVLVTVGGSGCVVIGIERVHPGFDAEAVDLETAREQQWAPLLAACVAPPIVDYDCVLEHEDALRSYSASIASHGPTSTPDLFDSPDGELAYYINAYNALTLLGVIDNWPIETVHDVHGPIRISDGFGFFYGLRFRVDGNWMSLHRLETDLIRERFGDARIHAAVNCASASCPALLDRPYRGDDLDESLDAVTEVFASEPPHVHIDHDAQQIVLSQLYEWYPDDYVEHARALGVGDSVLDWIAHYARSDVSDSLVQAREADYEIRYVPYDWSLNGR